MGKYKNRLDEKAKEIGRKGQEMWGKVCQYTLVKARAIKSTVMVLYKSKYTRFLWQSAKSTAMFAFWMVGVMVTMSTIAFAGFISIGVLTEEKATSLGFRVIPVILCIIGSIFIFIIAVYFIAAVIRLIKHKGVPLTITLDDRVSNLENKVSNLESEIKRDFKNINKTLREIKGKSL